MKRVDSDALGVLTRALGLTGAGSPTTELTDGILDQVIDVTSIIRRSRTQARTQGIYMAVLENAHGVGGSINTTVSPYNITGGVGVIAPYQAPMPAQFEIWLLGATLEQTSGTGTVVSALYLSTAGQQGFGVDDSGAAVVSDATMPLAFWDTLVTVSRIIGLATNLNPFQKMGVRLPRSVEGAPGTTLIFNTVASAIATYQCNLLLGVFPISLGQDVTV